MLSVARRTYAVRTMSTSPYDALFHFDQSEHARHAVRSVASAVVAEALGWPALAPCADSPDDRLRARAMTVLGLLIATSVERTQTRADRLEILSPWVDVVHEVIHARNGLEALALVMPCMLLANHHVKPEDLRALLERVTGPEVKDTLMTAGRHLIEHSVQQGERALLLRLLRKRFEDQVTSDVEWRVTTASADQIATWAERVLSAATLAELLAD